MGGRGHGAGVTCTDSVRHADQGEDPSRALNSALQAVSQRKERKKMHKACWILLRSQREMSTHTHTPSWRFERKKLKCDAELFDFFFFFMSIIPSKDFFSEFDEFAVQAKLRLVLRSV